MKLALLTLTCDRPEAFDLCWGYVSRMREQAKSETAWCVVNTGPPTEFMGDGAPDAIIEASAETPVLRFLKALSFGLAWARTREFDAVVFVEDDDWYAADYLHVAEKMLRENDVALLGFAPARYYHVKARAWWQQGPPRPTGASLCATILPARSIGQAIALVEGELAEQFPKPFIDVALWRVMPGLRLIASDVSLGPGGFSDGVSDPPRVVGIKGMPGARGLGRAHAPFFYDEPGCGKDPSLAKLREWIGADADKYERYYKAP